MAAEDDIIGSYVDRGLFQGDTEYVLDQLNEIYKKFKEINNLKLNIGGSQSFREYQQAAKAAEQANLSAAKATNELAKAQAAEAKAAKEAANAKLLEAKAATEAEKAKSVEQKTTANAAKTKEQDRKASQDLSNDYKQLSLAYNEATLRAKNYAITLGENHPITQQAVKDANDLGDYLKRLDASVGQYQRNVGNYSGAFTNFYMTLRGLRGPVKLLGEALGIGAQEADQIRLVIEHISQGISTYLRGKEEKVAAEGADAAVTKAAGAAQAEANVETQVGAESQAELAVATTATSTAMSVLKGALIATGIGAIVIGVSLLVEHFITLSSQTKNLKNNFNQLQKQLEDTDQELEYYFKHLDRLQEAPKVQLEIDNTNVPKLKALSNELTHLGTEALLAKEKYDRFNVTANTKSAEAGKAQNRIYDMGSKKLKEAFTQGNGAVEAIMDKLNDRDKELYTQYETLFKSAEEADEKRRDLYTQLDVTNTKTKLKTVEIAKQESEEERKIRLDNATAVAERIKIVNADILANEKSTLQQRLSAVRSNEVAELNIINAREKGVLDNPNAGKDERNAAIQEAETARKNITINTNREIFKEKEAFRIRDLEAALKSFNLEKDAYAKQEQDLAGDNALSLGQRLAAQQNFMATKKAMIDNEYVTEKEKLKNTVQTDAQRFALDKDHETKLLQLSIDAQRSITDILKSEIQKRQTLLEEDVEHIKAVYSRLDLSNSKKYAQDVIDLNNSLKAKQITLEQYNKTRKDIDFNYQQQEAQQNVQQLQEELNRYKFAYIELGASEMRLADLKEKLRNANSDGQKKELSQEIKNEEERLKNAKKNDQKRIELAKAVALALMGISDKVAAHSKANRDEELKKEEEQLGYAMSYSKQLADFQGGISDRRIQQIENELSALETKHTREIDLINQSTLSQVDKNTKIAESDARYAAKKKQLEDQEKQEQQKKAKFEKAAAIFSIVLNTAKAVMADTADPLTAWKIPFDIALGAAELAVAIATPIPKYAHGKNVDSYEGPAWVGDGGRREAIVRENGQVEITPSTPTLAYVKKRDIVLPDANMLALDATRNAYEQMQGYTVNTTNDYSGLQGEIRSMGRHVVRAIQNKKETHIMTANPLKQWVRSGGSSQEFLNQY